MCGHDDGPDAMSRLRTNVERPERLIRMAVGIALLTAIFLVPGGWGWLGLFGLFPLASGMAGWCPFYAWLMRD
jgi:hypothetical protein